MRIPSVGLLAMSACVVAAAASNQAAAEEEAKSTVAPRLECGQLRGKSVSPADIKIPSGAATVTDAAIATEPTPAGDPRAYCKVTGVIAARTKSAQAIRFEINLPNVWNGRSLMMGGGGFNGLLTTGLGPVRDAPAGEASPLAQGYVTIGTDSGHTTEITDVEPARFTLDDEMFLNFAHESYKKVSDVAGALIRSYYGRPAKFRYYMGGSEGGREALTMAQRYPNDFEGIVSVVPVISWTGVMNAFFGFTRPQFNGGALNEAKIRAVAKAVNTACDSLDGIEDGVVSNYLACPAKFDLTTLKCRGGIDAGEACLSDAQLATLQAAYGLTTFPFPLANGDTSYPGRLFGGEIEPVSDGIARWIGTGKTPPEPLTATAPRGVVYGINYVRFVIARDPAFDVRQYSAEQFAERVKTVSKLMDSTNPDLAPFYKRGGKLIIRENGGDFAQSPLAGIRYYENVVAKMGKSTADSFLRLYVSPASAHSGLAASLTTGKPVPTSHDLLADLDRWVSIGASPPDVLLQVDNATTPPYATQSSRPMCRYPNYPHYVSGNPADATSYRCERSGS